jgi:hypothetical protein
MMQRDVAANEPTKQQPSLKFHPDFSSEEADVILASKDSALHFRVHSFTLKSTSAFFQTMFTLPQNSNGGQSDIIYLHEDAEVLEPLLRMACGLPYSDITSLDLLESVIYAAEKYEMPGPMSTLRVLLSSPTLPEDPIRLYAIARKHDWLDVAKILSTRTLTLNIWDDAHKSALKTASSDALLDLFMLHRSRKESLREMLNNPPFVSGDSATCIQCNGIIDYSSWRDLKNKMLLEIEERPKGDTVLDPGISIWPEAIVCWKASCVGCNRLLYDKVETIRVVRDCIDSLRDTI